MPVTTIATMTIAAATAILLAKTIRTATAMRIDTETLKLTQQQKQWQYEKR